MKGCQRISEKLGERHGADAVTEPPRRKKPWAGI